MLPDLPKLANHDMKRLIACLLLLGACSLALAASRPVLKVGIYNNIPKVFVDQHGKPAGILVEILEQVAHVEGWKLDYVRCEWTQCLDLLASGQLDLLPDVSDSGDRRAQFAFHRVPVLHSWSQVYRRPEVRLDSILDLRDRKVVVLRGSVQEEFLPALLKDFGLNTVVLAAPSLAQAFRMVQDGRADAIATNQFYGDWQSHRSGLVSSPVVFLPTRLYYAAPPGRGQALLEAIDRHLAAWQADPGSEYFAILQRWQLPAREGAPTALWWSLGAVLALLLSALLVAGWLRRQVAERTRALRDSESKLASILDGVDSLIYIKDDHYRYQYVNRAMCRWLGKRSGEIIGKDDTQLFGPEAAAALHDADRRVIEAHERIVAEEVKPGAAADGGKTVFLSTKLPLAGNDGKTYGLCGISTDITARKRAEESLRVAATVFQSLEGMLVLGPDRRVIEANRAYAAMTGFGVAEMSGAPLPPFELEPDGEDFREAMWQIVRHNGKWQGEVWTWRKNGERYPVRMTVTAVQDGAGGAANYVVTQVDITGQKLAQDRIVQLAYFDALTGLPNRQLLLERIQHCLAFNHRSRQVAALLFLDLDNFKDLNDTRGHAAGDQLLQQVAARLAACARDTDTVARLGGDEFVILLEAVGTNNEEAALHADAIGWKIVRAVGEPYMVAGAAHHTTCSIGVALCGGEDIQIDDLMKRGDLAMYEAKKAGRNTLRFFHQDMEALVNSRTALEAELRTALRQSQFTLYYQAQVRGNGALTGVEALVRWRHPRRGLVGPGHFIGVAESSGLILPLGHWVLENACAQLARWARSPGTARLTIAVNVSVRQLLEPDFVQHVLAALAAHGADPTRLKLELTESMLIDCVDDTIVKMRELKAHGVAFSLDDFGTGYSSLSYLKRLPLDQLKIDRSFVHDVLDDPNDASIARSVVAMATALGLDIIAEGVETEAQRAFLAEIGCETWQGYLFSQPVEPAQLEALVH